jgi:hypothetical protein
MRLWRCVVATAASLFILSGNLFAQEVVKIGLPMPLTGVLASVGKRAVAGAQLYFGAGEAARAAVGAALANAVFDATAARVRVVPFTSERSKRS